jgi:hypothetical protein
MRFEPPKEQRQPRPVSTAIRAIITARDLRPVDATGRIR